MVRTLNLTREEIDLLLPQFEEYPALPAPSKYEKIRVKMGASRVTVYTSGKIVIQGHGDDIEEKIEQKIIEWLGEETNALVFGIDEVGRGEKNGPLVVGSVLGWRNELRGVRDSKKVKDIEKKYHEVTQKSLMQASISINAEMIDRLRNNGTNLNKIQRIIFTHLHHMAQELVPESITIADGKTLRGAPKGMVFQEKADDIEPSVGAASIIAKHTRNQSGNKQTRKTWKNKGEKG